MYLSKIVGMESWITIEASIIQIQSAQLFLSVLIQFLTSNDWNARITICLCPDCWRACLGAQFRLIQLNKFRICSNIKWFWLMYTTYKLITISYLKSELLHRMAQVLSVDPIILSMPIPDTVEEFCAIIFWCRENFGNQLLEKGYGKF